MAIQLRTFVDSAPIVAAAFDAGQAILGVYGRDFDVEYKDDRSPLTEADRASHEIIAAALRGLPEPLPVLSEESAAAPYETRRHWDRFWMVDPLDGTKEFVKRNGEFTVNIALICGSTPAFGAVYAPVLDVMYLGLTGVGAFKIVGNPQRPEQARFLDALADPDGKALRLPRHDAVQDAAADRPVRVVASRSHRNAETQAFIDTIEKTYGAVEPVSIGSSLKLCLVAEGAADLYPRIAPTMEWDTAAAQAVVEAAGGTVTRFHTSQAVHYNKPDLHNPYFVATRSRWPSADGVSDGNV